LKTHVLGIEYWMRPRNGLDSINGQLPGSFPPDARYLIGVSGRRDSVVLLHRPFDLGYRKLIVCHFNHRLRGRETFIHWQAGLRKHTTGLLLKGRQGHGNTLGSHAADRNPAPRRAGS
jgi:hypothetical protein